MKSNNTFKGEESFELRNKKEKNLAKALLSLKSEKEVASLLRDMMTLPEIEEFSNRLEIARLLLEDKSYLEIAKEVGTSTTTVTRVAHWLFNGCGGYWKFFKKK